MSAFFSDLQEEGNKRWYNIVADHNWELDQIAKQYHVKVRIEQHIAHLEVTPRQRDQKSYLEDNTSRRISSHDRVSRSDAKTSSTSDYAATRRVTDAERERRTTSVSYGTSNAQHYKKEIASVPGSNIYA